MDLQRVISEKDRGMKVKTYLMKELLMSNDLIRQVRENQGVNLNGKVPFLSDKIETGDRITVCLRCAFGSSDLVPYPHNLSILYEDPWIIAVDKSPFMVVHPLTNEENNTLANIVRHWQMIKHEDYTIRPVSRLDRNTSGVVLFAKNSYIQHVLQLQSGTGLFQKEYLALVEGSLPVSHDIITSKIGRKPGSIIEHQVSDTGKDAITEYFVIKQYKSFALIRIRLFTGRTHQIRVHMDSIGHPVTGDRLYGDQASSHRVVRQCLHAYQIQFEHPIYKNIVKVKSFLPKDIQEPIKFDII